MTRDIRPDTISRALHLAATLHRGQLRKGTDIPYLSHLLAVTQLVLEDGGDEAQAAAALLHDAAEDQGGEATLRLIENALGPEVAELVRHCSDALPEPGAPKAPWRERKQAVVDALPSVDRRALLILAADKLHNAQSTLDDLALFGSEVWTRFTTGRDGFLWYHDQMLRGLQKQLPTSRSVQRLEGVMQALHSA